MANTNVLKGMRCPKKKCKSDGPFRIEGRALFTVHDDGTDDDYSEVEWDDDSYCACYHCNYTGMVKNFRKKRP